MKQYQQFKNGFEIIKFYLQSEPDFSLSPYKSTLSALVKWLDWFIIELEYKEGVLIHNVNYLNRRINTYPAIELDIERRTIELHERLARQNQNSSNNT